MESFIRSDRLATWNEVCDAIEISFYVAMECPGRCHLSRKFVRDRAGRDRPIAEDTAWLALARKAADHNRN